MRARALCMPVFSLSAMCVLAVTGCSDSSSPTALTSADAKGGIRGTPTGSAGSYVVRVTLPAGTIAVGDSGRATVVITDSQGSVINGAATWTSLAPSVATIGANGMIRALTVGTVIIQAAYAGTTGSATLTVGPAPVTVASTVTAVWIGTDSLSLAPGSKTQAVAIAKDAAGNVLSGQTASWVSLTPAIATVSTAGVVTALAAGSAQIQGTVSGVSSAASLNVTGASAPVPSTTIASLSVSLNAVSLAPGQNTQANVVVRDASGTVLVGSTVSWSSLSPSVASVSSTGAVTAVAAGTATIQATAANGVHGSASLTVTTPDVAASALATVASVVVTLNAASLTVGQNTQANAVAKDASGNVIAGQTVLWSSLSPSVASVSSSGSVTAVSAGSAAIQASVGGVAGRATLTVAAPTVTTTTTTTSTTTTTTSTLLTSNFDSGTFGSLTNPWGTSVDVIDDPTGSGKGKVARMHYSPVVGSSEEKGLAYTGGSTRYGKTIWMKGDIFLPSGSAGRNSADNRKLIDFQGGGVRMTLHRVSANDLRLSVVDWMNGSEQETIAESTGLTIPDDRWTTIEVKMVTNSADNVRDGVLEVYLNGSSTPSYRRASGLGWITEKFVGPYGPGSYFNTYVLGFQLTISGSTAYQEDRYWDNVAFSTQRVTP